MITRIPLRAFTSQRVARTAINSICRPCLEASFRASPPLLRSYSSIPPQTPPPTSETEISKPRDLRSQFSSSPPVQQAGSAPKAKRSLRPYIYATLFFIVGSIGGSYVRLVIAPPPLPDAGTKEDLLMVDFLQKQGENLPLVQSLSTDPAWDYHDAYTSLSEEERATRLTTGPLAGARAVGAFQRIFYNKDTGECVAVVWFGGAISGWPGVTHGGLVATILDEQMGRCAIKQFPSQTGVTANLEINYLKPVVTNSYYVIRSLPNKEGFTDNKGWVSGRLETLEGKVCAEAKALFVVPKKFKTMVIKDSF